MCTLELIYTNTYMLLHSMHPREFKFDSWRVAYPKPKFQKLILCILSKFKQENTFYYYYVWVFFFQIFGLYFSSSAFCERFVNDFRVILNMYTKGLLLPYECTCREWFTKSASPEPWFKSYKFSWPLHTWLQLLPQRSTLVIIITVRTWKAGSA